MDREEIQRILTCLLDESGDNITPSDADAYSEAAGVRIFDAPFAGMASASDGLFDCLLREGVIGPHHMSPKEWLVGARSVVSFFFPFSEGVRMSNRSDMAKPSAGWLYARIEGQGLINRIMAMLALHLSSAGHKCVVPSLDARFWSKTAKEVPHHSGLSFTSCWSERHVAFICGLGTFGLSKGLITTKGVAGRFASIITDIELTADERPYSGIYDYCCICGECALNCPADAITVAGGKDHAKCSAFLDMTLEAFRSRYGCGKCQVDVPCEHSIPEKKL